MILQNKKIVFFSILLLLNNCSLNKNSNFWTKDETIKKKTSKNSTLLFKKEKILEKEFNSYLKINLRAQKNNYVKNLNNTGQINYDGDLKKISRFKYSKIYYFHQYESELIFDKNNIIFFNNKGSILKFSKQSSLIWKKNYYSKKERKKNPFLYFANNSETLIVADSNAKYYALNLINGNLLWMKNHIAPFNSEIKIYKDKFFVVDFENTLRCFSLLDGTELWKFKTTKFTIKSQKKSSVIVVDNKVIFSNSIGDITAINADTGNFLWQSPTQNANSYADFFALKTSDLISDKKSILFSNNTNNFFSLDINSGFVNWKQNINSVLRPSLIDDLIFTVTNEGFLTLIDNKDGSIIRVTDIFDRFSKKKRIKIKPEGFIVGNKNIYLTTNKGHLLIIDIKNGRTNEILKIDKDKISKPYVLDQNLFIVKDNAIIKLN